MISIEKYDISHSDDLTDLMINDTILRDAIGSSFRGTSVSFHQGTLDWIIKNNSKSFSIILSEISIGLISLSHIDSIKNTAQIGYWLSSKHWRLGFMSIAFNEVLQEAIRTGIKFVSSTIHNDNIASIKLWQKYDSVEKNIDKQKTKYTIKLPNKSLQGMLASSHP